MNLNEFAYFCGGGILTALLLLVGHWFPWPTELTRVQAYVYGVGSICAGFALWRLLCSDFLTAAGLAALCIVAGATVALAYKIDDLTLRLRQAKRAEQIRTLEKD